MTIAPEAPGRVARTVDDRRPGRDDPARQARRSRKASSWSGTSWIRTSIEGQPL